jgi:hypothetical protein
MTVAELRNFIDRLPGDMPVVYVAGAHIVYGLALADEVEVANVTQGQRTDGSWWEYADRGEASTRALVIQ